MLEDLKFQCTIGGWQTSCRYLTKRKKERQTVRIMNKVWTQMKACKPK